MGKKLDISGKRFGLLSVLCELPDRSPAGLVRWKCKCDCGNETEINGRDLTRGGVRSCGCLQLAWAKGNKSAITHGMTNSNIYGVWRGMLKRCFVPSNSQFARYGGRGIKVCERWMKFENFFADMGQKPSGMSIERVNNDGDYEPSNCKWATTKEQSVNRRTTIKVDIGGGFRSLSEIADSHGIPRPTVYWRHAHGRTGNQLVA